MEHQTKSNVTNSAANTNSGKINLKNLDEGIDKVNLAPLIRGDKNLFRYFDKDDQKVCEFFLSLSLFYNDLRNLHELMAENEIRCQNAEKLSDQEKADPDLGNLSGIKVHLIRLTLAHVHEFLVLLQKSRSDAVKKELNAIFKNLKNPQIEKLWNGLVAISQGKKTNSMGANLGNIFEDIRNKTAFHYDGNQILAGLLLHGDQDIKESEYCYYSIGPTMEQTRFHFADGAAQKHMETTFTNRKENYTYATDTLKQINNVLWPILGSFLRRRENIIRSRKAH